MSYLKLAPLAGLALLLSSTAHADPQKSGKPTHGIIIVDWPDEVHGAHSKRHGLISNDWPDEVRGSRPAAGLISNGWPLDLRMTPRPTTAPKGH